jgi:hypothetical protein
MVNQLLAEEEAQVVAARRSALAELARIETERSTSSPELQRAEATAKAAFEQAEAALAAARETYLAAQRLSFVESTRLDGLAETQRRILQGLVPAAIVAYRAELGEREEQLLSEMRDASPLDPPWLERTGEKRAAAVRATEIARTLSARIAEVRRQRGDVDELVYADMSSDELAARLDALRARRDVADSSTNDS